MPPRKMRKPLGMTWLKDRLTAKGWPVRSGQRNPRLLTLGPLTIASTTYQRPAQIGQVYGDRMTPGEGQAYAVITGGHLEPGWRAPQVFMSLESFTQIVEWLIEENPGSFLRPVKRKGFE